MRIRTLVGLIAVFTFGSILTASSASAYQLMEPSWTGTSVSATGVAVAETTAAPGPCPSNGASFAGGSLPKLGPDLQAGLAAYAKNPVGGNVDGWIDSGGPFGGGVPASAVSTLMRRGLAAGLTDEQVRSFLQPGFLRGMNDPRGGAWLFEFIGRQNDPAFLGQLAAYAQALDGRAVACSTGIRDDVRSAGAVYREEGVVLDGNLLTARGTDELPALANRLFRSLAARTL